MSLLRTGFSDQFFSTALPMLEDVVMERYMSKPSMIAQIFNVESSQGWGEQMSSVTGFGLAPTKAEGASTSYDDVYQGYDTTFTHATYSLGFKASKELIDDGKFNVVSKAAKALGRSMFNTQEILAANIFNTGFTTTYADGQPLFSLSHPLVAGGTEQNMLTVAADLSVTSLREAINDFAAMVDDRGLKIDLSPKWLVVPDALQWDAEELLKSSLRPDNANNAVNAFQMKNLDYLVWSYLTDPDAWFLLSDKSDHSLQWYNREATNTKSDYDFDADAAKTKIRWRGCVGAYDFRGVYGTPGA